jgi:hypothetical protein
MDAKMRMGKGNDCKCMGLRSFRFWLGKIVHKGMANACL